MLKKKPKNLDSGNRRKEDFQVLNYGWQFSFWKGPPRSWCFLKPFEAGSLPKGYPPPLPSGYIIGSAEALPILCVRCTRWERERERERLTKTIGNRKRDCAWGCARGINTTWENLQIEKHKSVRWAEWTPSWFVLFDLQISPGSVYSPTATSSKISFSISNSFWY